MCEYLYAAFSLKTRARRHPAGRAPRDGGAVAIGAARVAARGDAALGARQQHPHRGRFGAVRRPARTCPTRRRATRRRAARPAAVRRAGAAPLPLPRAPGGHGARGRRGFRAGRPGAADHEPRPTSCRGARSSAPSATSTGRSRPGSATWPDEHRRGRCSSARREAQASPGLVRLALARADRRPRHGQPGHRATSSNRARGREATGARPTTAASSPCSTSTSRSRRPTRRSSRPIRWSPPGCGRSTACAPTC